MKNDRKDLHPLLNASLEIKSMKLGLERMQAADRKLGFPSKQFASVQIAGTNGKGSVATKMAKALQVNGKKVGLFTSPHIHSFHERIQINGCPIPDDHANYLLKKILLAVDENLSFFELITLLAFCYFSEQKVDFAVLETGLGGRLDATNIVGPVLSVITSIDIDHIHYLGSTLEEIAFEKAGIIKPGVPALLGPNVKPHSVFEAIAEKVRSPLFDVSGAFAHYELENQAIAAAALKLLPFPLEKKSLDSGLAAVPPCRFEIVSQNDPRVILDVAHNPNGLNRAFERVFYTFPDKPIVTLAGFSGDKPIEDSLNILNKHSKKVYLTHTDHSRILPLGDPCFERAVERAYLHAKQTNAVLLICGTFFIMKEAKLALSRLGLVKESD